MADQRKRKQQESERPKEHHVELSPELFDERVMRHIKQLALYWGVLQRDVLWIAIKQFAERHPLDELTRLPNPFEGEGGDEEDG